MAQTGEIVKINNLFTTTLKDGNDLINIAFTGEDWEKMVSLYTDKVYNPKPDHFPAALAATLKHEGGYANVTGDTGGMTYAGITHKNHPDWPGWPIVLKKRRTHNEVIPELSEQVAGFYREHYWDKIRASEIQDQKVAGFLFDWYVNSGTHAIKAVQKLVGVTQDGKIGPKTIAAINSVSGLFPKLKRARIDFVQGIVKRSPSQMKFLKGWLSRINSFK